jgi:1-deoxy-D-xylulose-5-phosphate reductoisomerase
VYNAANEVAVEVFNAGQIGFLDIVETIERVVESHAAPGVLDLDGLLAADAWGRDEARRLLSAK